MSDFDLVIRSGTIVDGTGAPPFIADLAVVNGTIAEIGSDLGPGRQEIDARGLIVTPGFVDIHTHYDGQVTWEERLTPSSWHGVTTAVIGNCGVGFAPCRPHERDLMVRLMEGVEDIPHPVLTEGLPWTWESFGEYLDTLAERQFDMDVLAYVPHAPLRVYVMGERGANREPATGDDLAAMCAILEEALDAGALGLATSRTMFHRSSDGRPIPTFDVHDEELIALARTLKRKGKGTLQIVEDLHLPDANLQFVTRLAEESGRPVTFSIGSGNEGPMAWPRLLDQLSAATRKGHLIRGQVMPRAIGMILGIELTLNPFYTTPTYVEFAKLPLAARLAEMRKPEVRARILAEQADPDPALVLGRMVRDFGHMFLLGETPDYEQSPESSIAGMAAAKGCSPEELAYDLVVDGAHGGKLYLAIANFTDGKLDAVGEILKHPDIVLGLGDGGAHVGTICDGSYSTFALMHWARDRIRGRLPVEEVVRKMTRNTAEIIGLDDRGVLKRGMRADINVIDHDRLALGHPRVAYDLPAGGKRLIQRADGYVATLVGGEVVYRNGEATGALPGRLVRVA